MIKKNVEKFSTVKGLVIQEEKCIFATLKKLIQASHEFLKETYWNSMKDDVATMSKDMVVTY